MKSLALQNVTDYYQHVFRPDLTTVVVIGNVTREQAKAAVEKYFGDWKASGPPPETDLPTVPANSQQVTAVPDKSRVQVNATLAETLGLNRFNPDYYALELETMFSEAAFTLPGCTRICVKTPGWFTSCRHRLAWARDWPLTEWNTLAIRRMCRGARRGGAGFESDADGSCERGRFTPGQGDAAAANSTGGRERPAHCRRVDIARHDWLAARRTERRWRTITLNPTRSKCKTRLPSGSAPMTWFK